MFWTQKGKKCVELARDGKEPDRWGDGEVGRCSGLKGPGRFFSGRHNVRFWGCPFTGDGRLTLRRRGVWSGGGRFQLLTQEGGERHEFGSSLDENG